MGRSVEATPLAFSPRTLTRPHTRLQTYYLLSSLLAGPLYPFVVLPLLFRFYTLRYRFDDDGLAMSWGMFFRREIYLTYRRIQDIHLTRNLLQRWLGLATISVQTAAGSSSPEMTIEGVLEADLLRDYLYQKMRGARGFEEESRQEPRQEGTSASTETLVLLREIRDALRACAPKEHRA